MPPPSRLRSVSRTGAPGKPGVAARNGRSPQRSSAGGPAKTGPQSRTPRRPPVARVRDAEIEGLDDAESGPEQFEGATATRRVFTLILLSLFAPGSAQVVAGGLRAKRIGVVALKTWFGFLGLIALLIGIWFVHREFVLGLFTHQWALRPLAVFLIALGIAWPILLFDGWRLGRPSLLTLRNRRIAALLTAVLTVVVCLIPIMAGRRVWAGAQLLDGIFGSGKTSAATDGRYNVLLLGGDAGPDRVGTRPDSINLASIDEKTGRTVLLSFPRNLQNIPFPVGTAAAKALPNGWSCGDTCLLNAIYTWGSEHTSLFPGVKDAGAEAMKQAIQGVTGLTVNYYVMIDLQGFRSLIDAVGGIDIKVDQQVTIGGHGSPVWGYIKPGLQHMNGFHALWYGRSRTGTSDYARMARQRCVMTAMVNQLDPATLLAHFQDIAAAGAKVVSTDIPASELPGFLTLGTKAKSQKIDSVQFVPPLIVPHHPDFTVIRQQITKAIAGNETAKNGPAASPSAAASGSASGTGSTTGTTPSVGTSPTPGGGSAQATPSANPSTGAGATASPGATPAGDNAVDVRQVCQAA